MAARMISPELRIANHLLLSKETTTGSYKNVVFSPLSIRLMLSIIAAGSNGPVRDQLLSFLRSQSMEDLNGIASWLFSSVLVDSSSSGGSCLSFANGVWFDKPLSLKPSFLHVLENIYNPTLASLDFANKDEVAQEINTWAKRETRGLIDNIIKPASIELKNMIMANAIYFKGLWRNSWTFRESETVDGDFHLLDGSDTVKVPFMNGSHHQDAYAIVHQGFKILTLPYKNGDQDFTTNNFSMHIFLPDEVNGLTDLVQKVCSESIYLESILPKSLQSVGKVKIPKFKLSFEFKACSMLKKMGLVLPFMEGALTEMVEDIPVQVSEMIQKCIIEVNEQGTKAAATVRTSYSPGSAWIVEKPPPPMDFVADHPFLFLITGQFAATTLFMGQVLNPLDEGGFNM
ncbi:hypothetical protein PIB30_008293 [Stylosanthes scabra]|uniref:Serpin domain-containing protein n=1 Tax=Stylosanthes scabra TaxID=79078 RepID=A0ABU6S5D8_9FABA|nr:hypothetical protein [Stylosanthes scabra]